MAKKIKAKNAKKSKPAGFRKLFGITQEESSNKEKTKKAKAKKAALKMSRSDDEDNDSAATAKDLYGLCTANKVWNEAWFYAAGFTTEIMGSRVDLKFVDSSGALYMRKTVLFLHLLIRLRETQKQRKPVITK